MWHGKTVWITGASSGIGRALAEDLAERGAVVGLLARRREELEKLADHLQGRGYRTAWQAVDVTEAAEVDRATAELERAVGPCDVLIANAGVYRRTPGNLLDRDVSLNVLKTNLLGVVHCVTAVLPAMVERRGGHLVAIASLAARIGLPEGAAYCASKAALALYFESLRIDLGPLGIAVTTVFPGHVDTPMITDAERDSAVPLDRAVRRIRRGIERRRAEVEFPLGTSSLIRLARLLPASVRDPLVRKFEAMPEAGEETVDGSSNCD